MKREAERSELDELNETVRNLKAKEICKIEGESNA